MTVVNELSPQTLGNDVQVAIIGEHSYGAAKGTKRAVGIWVGNSMRNCSFTSMRVSVTTSRRA